MIRHSITCCCIATGILFVLPACSYFAPYKIDIQQGNIVAQEDAEKLKAGMTRSEVKNLIGTPLVADIYHADRWDYVYRMRRGWTVEPQRKLTVTFEKDVLTRIEGEGLANADLSAKK
ncbi:MAG: outer membrane protein assembly factor BamE [Burkholderiales bacterium]